MAMTNSSFALVALLLTAVGFDAQTLPPEVKVKVDKVFLRGTGLTRPVVHWVSTKMAPFFTSTVMGWLT
jgi:hypothetical protein